MHKGQRPKPTKHVAVDRRGKPVEAKPIDINGEGKAQTSFVPQTELGRRLWRIRQRIVNSGQPLLDWEGIESELRKRSGEATEEA